MTVFERRLPYLIDNVVLLYFGPRPVDVGERVLFVRVVQLDLIFRYHDLLEVWVDLEVYRGSRLAKLSLVLDRGLV